MAHELAHAAQHRRTRWAGADLDSGDVAEREANNVAARAVDPHLSGRMALSSVNPLRLQRCSEAHVPDRVAELDPVGKAGVVRRLIEADDYGTDKAVVQIFALARQSGQFVALQEQLDMAALFDAIGAWASVRIGALGPVTEGVQTLTRMRGELIRDTAHEAGINEAQVYAIYIVDSAQDDQVRHLLQWLADDNRYDETIGSMDEVESRLKARGIDPASFRDRTEHLVSDAVRGLGITIGDWLSSSEAARGNRAIRYQYRRLDLPEEHQEALARIDKAMMAQALTPANVAIGSFDYLTLGIPLGIYTTVQSALSGISSFASGEFDAGAQQVFPALLVVGTYVGVRIAARGGPGTDTGGGGGRAGGGTGRDGGRVRFTKPAVGGVLTIDDLLANFSAETQGGFAALRAAFADVDIIRGSGMLRKSTAAAAFVERNGQPGFSALLGANGDVAAAAATLAALRSKPSDRASDPKLEPKPAALAAGTIAGWTGRSESSEKQGPGAPLRWVSGLMGEKAIASGGVPGALDFQWGTDLKKTVYKYRITVSGRTYSADATDAVGWHGHHVWPKNIGGPESQPLMTVREALHLNVLHPALHAYLHALGYPITAQTSSAVNQAFIDRLGTNRAFRHRIRDQLLDFYALMNQATDPQMPTIAYRDGVDWSLRSLGG